MNMKMDFSYNKMLFDIQRFMTPQMELTDGGGGNYFYWNVTPNMVISDFGGPYLLVNWGELTSIYCNNSGAWAYIDLRGTGSSIYGGSGNDSFDIDAVSVFAIGNEGNDIIGCSASHVTIYGGAGNDTIGGIEYAFLNGGDGDDVINAGNHSTAYGGEGNDTISNGGDGNFIDPGSGDDVIINFGSNLEIKKLQEQLQ